MQPAELDLLMPETQPWSRMHCHVGEVAMVELPVHNTRVTEPLPSSTCSEGAGRIEVHGVQRPKTLSSLFYVDIQPHHDVKKV